MDDDGHGAHRRQRDRALAAARHAVGRDEPRVPLHDRAHFVLDPRLPPRVLGVAEVRLRARRAARAARALPRVALASRVAVPVRGDAQRPGPTRAGRRSDRRMRGRVQARVLARGGHRRTRARVPPRGASLDAGRRMTMRFFIALLQTNLRASFALRAAFWMQAGFMALNNVLFFTIWWILFDR